ncbi:MAG: hypothetical protein FWF29_07100, partial [Treponema sp.]|nr:hypothetical protein [Treponema sp.]
MKKPSSLSKIPPLAAWLVFHGGIFLALGISVLAFKPVSINSNFFDILPPALGLKGTVQADRILSDSNSRQAIVVAASP